MTVLLPNLQPVQIGQNPHDIDCAIAQKLFDGKHYEAALTTVNQVLDKEPDHPWAILLAGRVMLMMQKYGLGYNLLKRALSMYPRPDIKRNLASACIGVQRLEEAKRTLQELRRERPNDEKALALLCLLAVYDCDPKLAIELGEKSLAMKAGQKDVHESLGYARLMTGDFEKGWEGYERFIGASKYRPMKPPYEGCHYWDGAEGIDIYLRGEQGLGDELDFASILGEVAPKMRSVTLDCDEKLGGLFSRTFPNVEVHATRKSEKPWLQGREFDAWALIGTLAFHHRKTAEAFPGKPFLVTDQSRRIQWRALLDTLPGKRVGIAWTGGSRGTFRERRSLSLEHLLPIMRVPGVSWVSLQYQDPTDEIEEFHEKHGIEVRHWARAAESNDYDDQAALVAELDLVISVCTAVVHLAGGVGTKCWVLVPSKPRWWYGLEGSKSQWFDSVEFFRQEKDWPLHEVARRLVEFVK